MSIWSNNWKNQQNFIQDNQRVPVHTVLYIYIYKSCNTSSSHINPLSQKKKKKKRERSHINPKLKIRLSEFYQRVPVNTVLLRIFT